MSDCQSIALGFLKGSNLDIKAFRNMTNIMEPEAKDAIDRVAEMCIRIIGDQKSAIAKAGKKCNALAFAFFKCLGDKIFVNCPDKYWSSSECQVLVFVSLAHVIELFL